MLAIEHLNMNKGFIAEVRGSAVIIRFDRPEIKNPLSVAVLDGLAEILTTVKDSADVERVIFTGSADVFASGADLREIDAITAVTARNFAVRGQNLMAQIAHLPQTTVAAINGYCFGGALDLALSCKKRIAASNAMFCHPGAGLGIITGWGGTQRLPRLVGRANALMMFLTAAPIKASEALRIGLIDQLVSDPIEAAMEISV